MYCTVLECEIDTSSIEPKPERASCNTWYMYAFPYFRHHHHKGDSSLSLSSYPLITFVLWHLPNAQQPSKKTCLVFFSVLLLSLSCSHSSLYMLRQCQNRKERDWEKKSLLLLLLLVHEQRAQLDRAGKSPMHTCTHVVHSTMYIAVEYRTYMQYIQFSFF